jgi:TadE-like protein
MASRARAQAMVEFAMLSFLLMPVLLGILLGAGWIASYFMLGNAASEGARAGAFTPNSINTLSNINSRIRLVTQHAAPPWLSLADADVTISRCRPSGTNCPDLGTSPIQSGDRINVTATHRFDWFSRTFAMLRVLDQDISVSRSVRID